MNEFYLPLNKSIKANIIDALYPEKYGKCCFRHICDCTIFRCCSEARNDSRNIYFSIGGLSEICADEALE